MRKRWPRKKFVGTVGAVSRRRWVSDNRRLKYWYDIKEISGSHAEVTVSIAGLSLAILLILPIFTTQEDRFWDKPQIPYALLFFFSSLLFGIFASFAYSVASGDTREERYRLLAFIAPSVSFGISVPLLFLGFIYVLDVYLGSSRIDLFVLSVTRFFLLIAVVTPGVFVSRTILEAVSLWDSPCQVGPCPLENYSRWILIALIVGYGVASLIPLLRIYEGEPLSERCLSSISPKIFFVLLGALSFYLPFSYAFLTRHRPRKGTMGKISSFVLLGLFNLLLIMTLWLFA